MISVPLIFLVLAGQQTKLPAPPTEANLIGDWTTVKNSFKFELSEKAKADMKKQGTAGNSERTILLNGIRDAVQSLKLTFKPDHAFSVKASESPEPQKGKWTLKGFDVTTKMDTEQENIPVIKFSKDVKKLNMKFTVPDFGVGTLDLERAKAKS